MPTWILINVVTFVKLLVASKLQFLYLVNRDRKPNYFIRLLCGQNLQVKKPTMCLHILSNQYMLFSFLSFLLIFLVTASQNLNVQNRRGNLSMTRVKGYSEMSINVQLVGDTGYQRPIYMVQRVSRERRQAFCHWDQTQLSTSGVQLQSRAAILLVMVEARGLHRAHKREG